MLDLPDPNLKKNQSDGCKGHDDEARKPKQVFSSGVGMFAHNGLVVGHVQDNGNQHRCGCPVKNR